MAIVFLDRQHAGKPGKLNDRGAAADLDGDGKKEIHELEAMRTPLYLLQAEQRLISHGHKVITLSDGWYSDRHKRVNSYANKVGGRAIYVAAHLNAGGGSYGVVFYDHRSQNGQKLSEKIAARLEATCPELTRGVKTRAANPADGTKNAYYTIKGIGTPVAICFEPCFMDTPEHQGLLEGEGLVRIGYALADGINDWLEE